MCNNNLSLLDNVNLLIQQYKNTVNEKGLTAGILKVMQDNMAMPLCEIQNNFDINNANGFWLDCIGNIFGFPRPLIDGGQFIYFGFDGNGLGFDQATFVPDSGSAALIPCSDDLYKRLLRAWIIGLFTDGSLPSINKVIQIALEDIGIGHVIDNGDMTAIVYLECADINALHTIVKQKVIPKPVGVAYTYNLSAGNTFGFDGNGVGFDQGNFVEIME